MALKAMRKLSGAIERKLSTQDPMLDIVKPSAEVRLDGDLLLDLIDKLRVSLSKHFEELTNPINSKTKPVDLSTLYDQRDLDLIRLDNEYVRYFLLEFYEKGIDSNKLISLAMPHMLQSLAYMKSIGANDFKPEDFPTELYNSNFLCGYDRPGRPVTIFGSLRFIKKCGPWLQTYINFLVCIINQIKTRLDGRQAFLVFDASAISLQEIDFLLQILFAILCYMPGLIRHVYVVDLSPLYRHSAQLMIKVFPEKLRSQLTFITMSTFDEMYGDLRPYFMIRSEPRDVAAMVEAEKIEYIADMCPKTTISIDDYAAKHKIDKPNLIKFKNLLNSLENNNL